MKVIRLLIILYLLLTIQNKQSLMVVNDSPSVWTTKYILTDTYNDM